MIRAVIPMLAATTLLAAEPIPFLEFSFRDPPRPPPPLAAWWDEALAGAAAWGREQAPDADLAGAVGDLRQGRLVAAGATRAAGRSLRPLVAGWAAPATAGLRAEWLASVVVPLTQDPGGGRIQGSDAGLAVDATEPPPGLRVVLHGAAIDAEAEALFGSAAMVDLHPQARAAVRAWRTSAGVDPDGRGWWDTGLPAGWLAPVDPAVAALLPSDAVLTAAIAPDWGRIAAALDQLDPGWSRRQIRRDRTVAKLLADLAPADLGQGTWAVAVTPGPGLVVCIPRGAGTDALVARIAAMLGVGVPAADGGMATAPREKVALGRTAGWWMFGDRPARIRPALRVVPAVPSATAASLGWVQVSGAQDPAFRDALDAITEWLPLPERLRTPHPMTEAFLSDQGWSWTGWDPHAQYAAFAALPPGGIVLRDRDGGLRAELEGPMPWLLPGLALRWFAAEAQDRIARKHLRHWLGVQRQLGRMATRDDVAARVAGIDPERIRAASTAIQAIRALDRIDTGPWRERIAGASLPLVAVPDDAETVAMAAAIADAAAGLPIDAVHPAVMTGAGPDSFTGPAQHQEAALRMGAAALVLAMLGDRRGPALASQVLDLATLPPQGVVDQVMGDSAAVLADQAMLVAGLGGAPSSAMAAWLERQTPAAATRSDQALDGERTWVLGAVAASWLDGRPLSSGGPRGLRLETGLFAPIDLRAWTAEDLLQMMRWYGTPGHPRPGTWLPRSRIPMLLTAPLGLQARSAARREASHDLLRLAWRIHAAAPDAAPADATAAAALIRRPLQVAMGAAVIPLTYVRRSHLGFSLEIAADALPDSLHEHRSTAPAPAGVRLAIPDRALHVVIDPEAGG